MVIKFVCPNGHQLSTTNDRAGKPGKCPKCETKFLVPKPEKENEESSAEPEETITFLCPNGHELNGPASLKGRPGQCPHCGEKFQIPTFDEEDEEEEEESPAEPEKEEGSQEKEGIQEVPQEADAVIEIEEFEEVELSPFSELSSDSSFADIFAQFWQHREKNDVVKLTLRNGETIEPQYFAAGLSQGDYGFFAVKEKNGDHTMTVARWDAVLRIDVGQGDQLPPGIFD